MGRGVRIEHVFINGIESKQCSKCNIVQSINDFYSSKVTTDGRRSHCANCERKANARAYAKDPDYAKKRLTRWAADNPDKIKKAHRKRWLSEHRKAYTRMFGKKISSTPKGQIDNRMRWAIWDSLSGGKNGRKWNDLVGYTTSELLQRLSETMPDGYSWGRIKELHIDHIIPRSYFRYDSVDDPEFLKCWGLANLQLLPAAENLKKGNKIIKKEAYYG